MKTKVENVPLSLENHWLNFRLIRSNYGIRIVSAIQSLNLA